MKKDNTIVIPKGMTYLEKSVLLESGYESFPAGRIMKTYTGIGATTCELEDMSRNTLLVMPTRALAASKALKHGAFYFGSEFQGQYSSTTDDLMQAVQQAKKGKAVKACCVADTFNKIYLENPEFYKKNFHLFIDEVDTFQSEANYRVSLDDTMEIFLDFPEEKRTIISATMQDFLNQTLQKLPLTTILMEEPRIFQLLLFRSIGDFPADIAFVIRSYMEQHPNNKILVALNGIDEILRTIGCIGDTSICHVLCSSNSFDKVPSNILKKNFDSKLERQVTFMTSAFFVGVDIDEDCFVIAAGKGNKSQFLLTQAKIMQIFGRPRNPTLLERAFIYQTDPNLTENFQSFRRDLKRDVKNDKKECESKIRQRKKSTSRQKTTDYIIEEFAKESILKADACVYRYMNADTVYQEQIAKNFLYRFPEKTKNELVKTSLCKDKAGKVQDVESLITPEAEKIYKEIKEIKAAEEKEYLKLVTEEADRLLTPKFGFSPLTGERTTERYRYFFEDMQRIYSLINERFEDESDELFEKVRVWINEKSISNRKIIRLKDIYDKLYYRSMLKDEKIKSLLTTKLSVGTSYSKSEIIEAIRSVYPVVLRHFPSANPITTDDSVMTIANYWFCLKRKQKKDPVSRVVHKKLQICALLSSVDDY